MKDRKIQEKEKINMQLENKRKLQKSKEKGITLIALVVTIIILLILAGVTLNMAMSGDGLFSRARNAADKYKKAQEDESQLVSEIEKEMNSEYVGAYITGYTPTSDSCTITGEQSGTGVTQTFTTTKEQENEEGLKWRIWDYDGTTLRIILDKPTTQTLQLKGVAGYNIINEICRQCFGQYEGDNDNKKMKEGISVANLRRSDIEKVSSYDYTKYKHRPSSWLEVFDNNLEEDLIYYGDTKEDKNNFQAPTMWSNYDSKWNYNYNKRTDTSSGNASCETPWEQENGSKTENDNTLQMTEFKQSYYSHEYKGKENEFKNLKYYDMIFTKEFNDDPEYGYWLAGRYVGLYEEYCDFGLHLVSGSNNRRLVNGWLLLDTKRRYLRT